MSTRRRRSRRPIPRKAAVPSSTRSKEAAPPAAKRASPKPVEPSKSRQPAAGKPEGPKDPYIGKKIGRCRIEERIGVGKTATVYRAHYEALDDYVAVKVLTPQASALPKLVERFQSEAKVIARIDNENVVKIYDVGTDGDAHYMVMELLDGYSVLDLIEREDQVDPTDALRIARQTANGLAAAHALNIIHRDVKPQNLLLLEDGTVKVLDFGLAATFDDDASERIGTPHYMAPEVCAKGSADLGTDIYGLGIVLYHMLVGQPPYAGKDLRSILAAHVEGIPLRPEKVRPGLSREIGDLVRTLTKPDPLTRPTAAEVVTALDAIGGEALKEKDTLKRRSRGARSRAAVRKRSPVGPALVAGVVVIGLVIAFSSMSGKGDSKGSGSSDSPGTNDGAAGANDASTVGAGNPPLVPTETDAERAAREAQVTEADEAAIEERRVRDSKRSLAAAETWAREHWTSAEDTKAVIDKYQSVYSRFKRTDAADEARRRIKGIKDNSIHPHPDRSWSDETSIADARKQWRTVRPKLEALIKRHRYSDAMKLLPERVSDKDGELSKDLRFWESTLASLRRFQSELPRAVKPLESADRTIQTPDGDGEVRTVERYSMKILVDGDLVIYDWEKLDPAQIFALSRPTFADKPTEFLMQALAFAFAHRLQDAFWDTRLDLSGRDDVDTLQSLANEFENRFDARIQEK